MSDEYELDRSDWDPAWTCPLCGVYHKHGCRTFSCVPTCKCGENGPVVWCETCVEDQARCGYCNTYLCEDCRIIDPLEIPQPQAKGGAPGSARHGHVWMCPTCASICNECGDECVTIVTTATGRVCIDCLLEETEAMNAEIRESADVAAFSTEAEARA